MYLNFCGSYLIGVSRAAETSMLLLIQVRVEPETHPHLPSQMHCNLKDGNKLTIEIINIKERGELGTNCLATELYDDGYVFIS